MDYSEIVIGSLSVLTGGVLGTAAIYFYTKESMWEGGRDNFLPLNSPNSDWELIKKDLSENNNITDEEIKKFDTNQLKTWCSEKYKETFSSLFHSPNWMKLAEMKNACLLPIRKKLKSSEKTLIEKPQEIKIDKLKHIDSSKYQLTYKLKSIKSENDDTNMQRLLFSWCHNVSEHGYQSENSNKYRLIEALCINSKN